MPVERRIFVGGANSDAAKETQPANVFTSARNIVLERGAVETAWGNLLMADPDWLATDNSTRCVGAATDASTDTAYLLLYSTTGQHQLARLSLTGSYSLLLQWEGLNLPDAPTKNVELVDNLLLYLDARGELRSVNVERAALGDYTPDLLGSEPWCLHAQRVPPQRAPLVERVVDASVVGNQLEGKAWQVAIRWRYRDGELTVFSPLSEISDAQNLSGPDPRNALRVVFDEPQPSLVSELELLVRQDGQPTWLVAKRWQRDANGGLASVYHFTGPTTGEAVPADDALRQYEALWPAESLTVAQNRAWLANLTEGYKTPTVPMTLLPVNLYSGQPQQQMVYVMRTQQRFKGTDGRQDRPFTRFYVLASGSPDDESGTYYEVSYADGNSNANNSAQAWHRLSRTAVSYREAFVDKVFREVGGQREVLQYGLRTIQPVPPATLRAGATYGVSFEFYDAFGRPFGAQPEQTIAIPAQNYRYPSARTIQWSIPSDEATAQRVIPAQAATYAVVLSQNRTASLFQQGVAADVAAYLGRDEKDNPILSEPTRSHTKLWVDIGNWALSGNGYSWKNDSGDRLRFLADGRDFLILDQQGDYLEIEWSGYPAAWAPVNYSNNVERGLQIEIYTPTTTTTDNVFYHRSPRYRINRDTGQARFSVTEGTLTGDTYLSFEQWPVIGPNDDNTGYNLGVTETGTYAGYSREVAPPIKKTYSATTTVWRERMAPLGRPGGIWLDERYNRLSVALPEPLQQVRLRNAVRYSDPRLQGTQTNGLSVWRTGNIEDQRIGVELGPIRALTRAADSQTDSTIILAICEQGAASLTIGVSQARQADGGTLFVDTDRVVGAVNTFGRELGTRHPATVTRRAGRVYWWDAERQAVVRYNNNGPLNLSATYQLRNRSRELAAAYASALLHGGYDPGTESYLLFLGSVGDTVATCLAYCERAEAFAGELDLPAEFTTDLSNRLVSVLQGKPYDHLPMHPRLSFFGQTVKSSITFCANQLSEATKIWKSIGQSGPLAWNAEFANDLGQQSYLLPKWLRQEKGIWTAALRRDTTKGKNGLLTGPELQSPTLDVILHREGEEPARLVSVDLNYLVNPGQAPPR